MTFQWPDLTKRSKNPTPKTRGKFKTRKELEEKIFELFDQGMKQKTIAEHCAISQATVSIIIRNRK